MTLVRNVRSTPGWEEDPNGVYIGRAGNGQVGYFGNPYSLKPGEPRGTTLEKYGEHLERRLQTDIEFRRSVAALYGKTLYCFCKPAPCHGDYLKAEAEALQGDIFCDSADVYVVTTNQYGAMGRGLALLCKTLYPEVELPYRRACSEGTHKPESGLALRVRDGKIIFLTPTKCDPRQDSSIEDVEQCILDIKRRMEAKPDLTVALPPLGAGLGRLPVAEVRKLVDKHLQFGDRLHLVGGW